MFDKLIVSYGQLFEKFKEEGKDEWVIVKCSVPLKLLNELYNRFVSQTEEPITPLEQLTLEQKTNYWNISKRYYTSTNDRIKAARASYVLNLITSNE